MSSLISDRCSKLLTLLNGVIALVSFGLLLFHFSKLYERHTQEPVTIQTTNFDFEYPEIHLCPQFPFSDSRISMAESVTSKWPEFIGTMSRMTDTISNLTGNITDQHAIALSAFWETLDNGELLRSFVLPKKESVLRFKINDVGKLQQATMIRNYDYLRSERSLLLY